MMTMKTSGAMRAKPDVMPRSLAATLVFGALIGGSFWAAIAAIIAH